MRNNAISNSYFSSFRMAFFRYFVFSLGVISSWRRAITPGEKTKERNNEMAQTSHHSYLCYIVNQWMDFDQTYIDILFGGWVKLVELRCPWHNSQGHDHIKTV